MTGFLSNEKNGPAWLFTQEPVESTREIGYAAMVSVALNLCLKEGGKLP
jgi:hypothetical protein